MRIRDLIKLIEHDGWVLSRTRGSHRQYRHPSKGGYVTIHFHTGQTIRPRTIESIIEQAGLTVEQFTALL